MKVTIVHKASATNNDLGQKQGNLFSLVEEEINSLGMGVLSDGTPYLNQRGLAHICGVKNAHIGTISSQWNDNEKPRIEKIKEILKQDVGTVPDFPHVEITHEGRSHYCYPVVICLAVLQYYAFEAGANCQKEARDNFRKMGGDSLSRFIYEQVGYNPKDVSKASLDPWLERLKLNYKSAPDGYFSVFNDSSDLIYEMIQKGIEVNKYTVPDISIGKHWSSYWQKENLSQVYGEHQECLHWYPESHPQSYSNPQRIKCYPMEALGCFKTWLRKEYVEGGKLVEYFRGKEKRKALPEGLFGELALAFPSNIASAPDIADRE
ncbi:hypothetical protein [Bombella saccharophila]|uniref:BstA-like C-terminal domain-containing protein n=1 Tax=Bombella saccharophila TaxID=2967338 RepID=A0ABT3W7W9_9PROT|nr:hypothetical protein [Bombella saccharophila]MCX5614415.1 hypothetical protein [Bombella saccharophila]